MTYLLESELLQPQDKWKRSQIRLTPTLHKAVVDYTSERGLSSLNTALLALINQGLTTSKKLIKRKVVFTEYNASVSFDDYSPSNNEAVRMACAKFMSDFFNDHPDHEFMQLESKTMTNKKGHEILIGVRIWYSYTA